MSAPGTDAQTSEVQHPTAFCASVTNAIEKAAHLPVLEVALTRTVQFIELESIFGPKGDGSVLLELAKIQHPLNQSND
jgi:hypothetical protein